MEDHTCRLMNFSHQSKPVTPINYILLEPVCIKINFTMTLILIMWSACEGLSNKFGHCGMYSWKIMNNNTP